MDANAVLEAQRANLFKLARRPEDWIAALPPAIQLPVKSSVLGTRLISELTRQPSKAGAARLAGWAGAMPSLAGERFGRASQDDRAAAEPGADVFAQLPQIFDLIEVIIEQCTCFEAYLAELEIVRKLDMTFADWRSSGRRTRAQRECCACSWRRAAPDRHIAPIVLGARLATGGQALQ